MTQIVRCQKWILGNNLMNHFFKTLCLCFVRAVFFCIATLSTVSAKEVIKRFDSLVQVAKDGTFRVTETIVVNAESRKIRRGIYRDFPLYNEDADGVKRKVGFKLISVKRDDKLDKTRIENRKNGIRIYIGREDYFLPKGLHTYIITYETDRQMRYFDDHDEIYWNATGNFWDFPIETVLAQIVLPEGTAATDWDVFTGRQGSKEKDATIGKIAGKRVIKYRNTKTLNPREGMTVLAKVDKGAINPPSEAQLSKWWWEDNGGIVFSAIGLALILFYYFYTWWYIGRDRRKGVIVPRWNVSNDLSPALVNYIDKKGLSGKGFDAIASAILSLAVKKLVTLNDDNNILAIKADNAELETKANLPAGEKIIFNHIRLALNEELIVSASNGTSIKHLQKNFSSKLENEHRNKFYKHNLLWVGIGVALSFLTLIFTFAYGNVSKDALAFIFFGGIATIVVSVFVINFGKNLLSRKNLIGNAFQLIIIGFFVFSFVSSTLGFAASSLLNLLVTPWVIIMLVAVIVLNVLFFFLLGAPTQLGRQKMDEIEGLKTYLTLAEKDRMNMKDAPDFSIAHYEKLLPYAVALGVEKPWSKSFQTWLAAAVAAGAVAASYSPNWYRGRNFRSDDLSNSMDGFTNSMQSGFADAMPVPKSSSSGFSGSGGFSGGGGGGGGGGGW